MLRNKSLEWQILSGQNGYTYTKDWLGLPIIQRTDDMVQVAELIHQVKPDTIIETGIARGGSLVFFASLLCLLDVFEGIDPRNSKRKVLGIDVDIRPHNRELLDNHPLRFKMKLIEGSSVDPQIINHVRSCAESSERLFLSLDSNHTHAHVVAELNAYADLVSLNSYCVVFDTIVEDLPAGSFPDRPWDIGNNPKTAVYEWLKSHPEFEIDKEIDNKLLVSAAPNGYIKRIF